MRIQTSSAMYDTFRLKFRYNIPDDHPFFAERIRVNELAVENESSRFVRTNNQWRRQMCAQEIYTPKFWLEPHYKYPDITYFVTEFSAPKLIYGESITPIEEENIHVLVSKLQIFFQQIQVQIDMNKIYDAIPIVVAIGKNIDFTKLCPASIAIQSFEKMDYRPRSRIYHIGFADTEFGGREMYLGNRQSSWKIYEKMPEVANNAVTSREKQVAEALRGKKYDTKQSLVCELARFELTLRNQQAVKQKLGPYMEKGAEPTLKNIFSKKIPSDILKKEMDSLYNTPLTPYVFISLQRQSLIQAHIDTHIKQQNAKDMLWGILRMIEQGAGIAEIKRNYTQQYCRATWYNYLNKLKQLQDQLHLQEFKRVCSADAVNYALQQFGIDTNIQQKLL